MTRNEFCEQLALVRQNSNIKMTEICSIMGVMPTAIYRLEKGYNNFEVDKVISYINALHMRLALVKDGQLAYIDSSNDFSIWLKQIRSNQYTQRSLAEQAGCTYQTIANIERSVTVIRIETLLKLVDVFGYTIKIEPK